MIRTKPTLRDVAKRAGVSLGTASNALNNRAHVSEDARTRVLEAADALGYHIRLRPTVARGDVGVIGVIGKVMNGETITVNPFYSHVLAGIERECQQHHISLLLANIEVDRQNRPINLPPMVLDGQVDGILMIGTFLEDTIHLIGDQFTKPVVLVDSYAPGMGFDSAVTDNLNGAFSAVEYLIWQGHQHIGLVGSTPDAYPSIRERRKGYMRALKRYHIPHVYIEDSLLTHDEAQQAARTLLERAPQITAIFACNDEAAAGVYSAAQALGRAIPRDLSVIGFDDIDLAQQMTPPLTTIHVEKTLLGTIAVRHLKDRIENPQRPSLTTLISTQPTIRASVRPLK